MTQVHHKLELQKESDSRTSQSHTLVSCKNDSKEDKHK
jgi:hypothetical protein